MAFIKISEQPSLYDNLEKKTIHELLTDINTEDKKVAFATEKAIPQIEKLVSLIVPRMKKGGRIFYMGAGTSGRLGVLDASEIPPTFGVAPTHIIGLIAGGDTALRNAVEKHAVDSIRGELGHKGCTEFFGYVFFRLVERIETACFNCQSYLTVVYQTPVGFGRTAIC